MLIIGVIVWTAYLWLFCVSRKMKCSGQSLKGISLTLYKMSLFLLSKLPEDRIYHRNVTNRLALLYPTYETRLLNRHYYAQKLSMVLAILFIGTQFVLVMRFSDRVNCIFHDGYLLDRGNYGETAQDIELSVKMDEEETTISYQLQSRKYGEDEVRRQMAEFERNIEHYILGENKSLEQVTEALNLQTSYDALVFTVDWESEDYTVLDSDGSIVNEDLQKPLILQLTANMTYETLDVSYTFPIQIYPREKTDKERTTEQITAAIMKADEKQKADEVFVLPHNIGVNNVTYIMENQKAYIGYFLALVCIVFILYCAKDRDLDKKTQERKKELLLKYPEFVSQFVLLMSAGMTVRGVLIRLSEEEVFTGYLHQELQLLVRDFGNGILETDALERFGRRCESAPYVKLCGLLIQNMKKGNSELLKILQQEAHEAFTRRKNDARKLGEEAGTKLLVPMMGMLAVVMIVIVVPAFLSFQM